ncbi:PHA/PHB synthase family protein [Tsukamurella asaccharolytica]|nr:poly-beta-hydroxybutyrate polymerase [Tsukamurella asaccharolytica]
MQDRFLVEEQFANDFSGLDPLTIGEVVKLLAQPGVILDAPKLAGEWSKVLLGLSEVEVPERDPQYGDVAWRENAVFRRLAQAHLAWAQWLDGVGDEAGGTWESKERERYVKNIVTSTLSPANIAATNPAAIRKAIDTGGKSLLRGGRTFLTDVLKNGGLPRMTDTAPYEVGENVGVSAGTVVYREDMFEIIHYTPSTELVHERPLLFVPPQLGRFYILDLAPERSLVEHAVSSGMQSFMLVWRNPRKDPQTGDGTWGIDDYVAAVVRAFDVVTAIAGTDDLNVLGFCAGGFTSALAQAHLTAKGRNPVHAATYLVTMIDTRRPNLVTPLSTPGTTRQIEKLAKKNAVIDAQRISSHFAWLRPQDLIFGHVINNWLMGEAPRAYDLLAWNDDQVNLTARFIRDATRLMGDGSLVEPGAVTILDTEIDLTALTADKFVVAAQTDHITTWRPCYMTARLLGGETEVAVTNKGHVQTVVSQIAKSRQKFWLAPADTDDPDEWMAGAQEIAGSWWPVWSEWLSKRAGDEIASPEALGSRRYPPRDPAPGRYVRE